MEELLNETVSQAELQVHNLCKKFDKKYSNSGNENYMLWNDIK